MVGASRASGFWRTVGNGYRIWFTAVVLVLGAVAPLIATSAYGGPWVMAIIVVAALWLPGTAIADVLGLRETPLRDAIVVALSLVWSTVLAVTTVYLDVYSPTMMWVFGIILPAVVSLVWNGAFRWRNVAPPEQVDEGPLRPPHPWGVGLFLIATELWAAGMFFTDAAVLDGVGLESKMHWLWWAGVLSLIAIAAWTGLTTTINTVLFKAQLVSLVAALHLPGILLNEVPRFPWTYKHIGVTDYISQYKTVDPLLDIYHAWPGFFALVAWFHDVGQPGEYESYVGWTQIVVNFAALLLLSALFKALGFKTPVRRLALLLAIISNWFGQDYYAPQALAYLLAIGGYLLMAAITGTPTARSFIRLPRWLSPTRSLPTGSPPRPVRLNTRTRQISWMLAMAVAWFALIATHQLTPVFVLAVAGMAAVLGAWRSWNVVFIGAGVMVAHMLSNWSLLTTKYNLKIDLDFSKNAGGASAVRHTVVGENALLTADAVRILTGVLVVLAVIGFFRGMRAGQPVVVPGIMAFAPATVLLVQSYGGEAVYRVAFFSMIGLVPLAACGLVPREYLTPDHAPATDGIRTRSRAFRDHRVTHAVVPLVCMALGVVHIQSHYGIENVYRTSPDEVAVGKYLYGKAPAGATVFFPMADFPLRTRADYWLHLPTTKSWGNGVQDPQVMQQVPSLAKGHLAELGDGTEEEVIKVLEDGTPTGGCAYVVFGTASLINVETYQYEDVTVDGILALKRLMDLSDNFEKVITQGEVEVFRLQTPGKGGPPATHGASVASQRCSGSELENLN